jgi:hypothetical protein
MRGSEVNGGRDRRHLRLKSIEGMRQTGMELNCTLLIYTNDTEQGNDEERC